MRTRNTNTIFYAPEQLPEDPKALNRYIETELRKIQSVITALSLGHLDETHVAPEKPRDGDVRFADGTHWNPVAGGQGFYGYYNSAWHKLG